MYSIYINTRRQQCKLRKCSLLSYFVPIGRRQQEEETVDRGGRQSEETQNVKRGKKCKIKKKVKVEKKCKFEKKVKVQIDKQCS